MLTVFQPAIQVHFWFHALYKLWKSGRIITYVVLLIQLWIMHLYTHFIFVAIIDIFKITNEICFFPLMQQQPNLHQLKKWKQELLKRRNKSRCEASQNDEIWTLKYPNLTSFCYQLYQMYIFTQLATVVRQTLCFAKYLCYSCTNICQNINTSFVKHMSTGCTNSLCI